VSDPSGAGGRLRPGGPREREAVRDEEGEEPRGNHGFRRVSAFPAGRGSRPAEPGSAAA
jgi:hypothetical protein